MKIKETITETDLDGVYDILIVMTIITVGMDLLAKFMGVI